MNRRQFIVLGVSAAALSTSRSYGRTPMATLGGVSLKEKTGDKPTQFLFAAYDDQSGKHYASRLSLLENQQLDSMLIPFRAHDTLPLSAQKSLSFGRRPHNQMIVCDFDTKQQTLVNANQGRHFYGHGCLQPQRSLIFTTENDYDNAKGVIGIRDSENFQQIGEFSSYGIGPHDIQLMPDNKTLVVANGGIQTHPDFGRRKLNLKTMQPSLVFIDSESGNKIDEYRLPDHQLSIRHLSITANGKIAVATQYQGQLSHQSPDYLLAYLGETGLQPLRNSQKFVRACRGYIGDIAVDSGAQIIAATSPRGNNISFWDSKKAELIRTLQISNPNGLCFDKQNQRFLVSNDKGVIYTISAATIQGSSQFLNSEFITKQRQIFPVKWDNHMMIYN